MSTLKGQLGAYLKLLKSALAEPTPEHLEELKKVEPLYRLGFSGEREAGDEEIVTKLHEAIAVARDELERKQHVFT